MRKEVSDLKCAFDDTKVKRLANNKDSYERELQSLREQIASLQKSLDDEKLANDEASRATELCILEANKVV